MCSRPRTEGEWASDAVLCCGSRGGGERVERRKGVSQICTAGGLARWVLASDEFTTVK